MKRLLIASLFLALSCISALAQTVATTTNSSAVITVGNTFQTVLAAITQTNQRRSLTIQNNNAADSCWIFIGSGAATKATSMVFFPGGSYTRYYPYVPSDVIQATCASTSDTLYIDIQ